MLVSPQDPVRSVLRLSSLSLRLGLVVLLPQTGGLVGYGTNPVLEIDVEVGEKRSRSTSEGQSSVGDWGCEK